MQFGVRGRNTELLRVIILIWQVGCTKNLDPKQCRQFSLVKPAHSRKKTYQALPCGFWHSNKINLPCPSLVKEEPCDHVMFMVLTFTNKRNIGCALVVPLSSRSMLNQKEQILFQHSKSSINVLLNKWRGVPVCWAVISCCHHCHPAQLQKPCYKYNKILHI